MPDTKEQMPDKYKVLSYQPIDGVTIIDYKLMRMMATYVADMTNRMWAESTPCWNRKVQHAS